MLVSSFAVVEVLGRIFNLPPQQVGQHGIFIFTIGDAIFYLTLEYNYNTFRKQQRGDSIFHR